MPAIYRRLSTRRTAVARRDECHDTGTLRKITKQTQIGVCTMRFSARNVVILGPCNEDYLFLREESDLPTRRDHGADSFQYRDSHGAGRVAHSRRTGSGRVESPTHPLGNPRLRPGAPGTTHWRFRIWSPMLRP